MMNDIENFKNRFNLKDITLIPYGSRVYGTNTDKSDYDYIVIVPDNTVETGTEYHGGNTDINVISKSDFQIQLDEHKIHALESFFLIDLPFKFKLNLGVLRESISQKASHSFVKAKKKIEVEKDYRIGWKSLFHSLRILDFGIQVATFGKIKDYGSANKYWFEILGSQRYDWDYYKDKYQPVYNRLATDFRKLAPKEK